MALSSYFGTRPTPWARTNAVIVDKALTAEEAMKAAKLDFEVLQEPIFDGSGKKLPGYRVNRKSDDGSILGLVTDRYKVVQNTDAFAFTDALIGQGCHYETAGSVNNFKTVWLQASLEPRQIMGDWYNQFLIFKNSFDGKGAVKVCETPIRVICQNTLNLALKRAERSFSVRHTGDIAEKVKQADMTLQLSERYFTEVNVEYVKLARIRLSQERVNKFWETLFPVSKDASKREKDNAEYKMTEIRACYNAPDLQNFRGTGFGVINAVSDMIAHSAPLKMTDSYFGNLFDKVTNGHPLLDRVYEMVLAEAK